MALNFQATRYYLDETPLQQPYPWNYGYAWNRSAAVYDGSDTYFVAKLEIGGLQFAQPGLTKIFKATKSGWVDVTNSALPSATKFQITREILVADLNADGFDDFFLNNHGAEPPNGAFPGEKNAIYLYDKNQQNFSESLTPYMDFSHGSSIGDFDADGRLDIFVNNLGAVEQIPSYLLSQSVYGRFDRVDLSPSLQTAVGPLTGALDVGNDGTWDLATTAVNERSFIVWSNILASNPTRFATNDLPMPVSGVFEIVSSDFDADGNADVLVVGNDNNLLRAAFYFSAGTASQKLIQPLIISNINDFITGGIRVFVNDLDNNGTKDIQLHTNLLDWSGLRILIFFDADRNPSVVRMGGNANGVYVDQNSDGVVDFVTEDGARLNTYFGKLKERFSNRAFDVDGNAGQVAKILGAVFGKDALSNKEYVGIGLDLLDKGMSYDTLAGLALNAAKVTTNDQIVTTLWTNVVGSAPSAADKAPFIKMLEDGMTPGELARIAADTSLNTTNINLVGLAQTGIEYTPVA